MSVEKIADKIINDATKRAALLIENAKKEAQNAIEKAKIEGNSDSKVIESFANKNNADNLEKSKNLADLEGKKIILRAKQECIDNVYESALNKIEKLSDEEYLSLIKSLLSKIEIIEKAQIILNKRDKERITAKTIAEINPLISMSEKEGAFRAGFVLTFKDTEYNCSFEVLIKAVVNSSKKEIAEILFN